MIAAGIDCLRGRASLEQLARFDRPLIVVLHQDEHQAHALLQGVGATHVRLDIAGERYELARASLSKFWNGEFIALWRCRPTCRPRASSAAMRVPASPGSRGGSPRSTAARPNRGLHFSMRIWRSACASCRVAYGIKADGIVGPETLFALSALDDSGPRLARTVQ